MSVTILVFLAVLAASDPALTAQAPTAHPVKVSSPDGRIRAELNDANGFLRYRVVVDGKQVLAPSRIGIQADDVELGEEVTLGSPKTQTVNEHYRTFRHAGFCILIQRSASSRHDLRQEPYAVARHVRICAGAVSNGRPYRDQSKC